VAAEIAVKSFKIKFTLLMATSNFWRRATEQYKVLGLGSIYFKCLTSFKLTGIMLDFIFFTILYKFQIDSK
jgi:hypothetical protein